MNHVAKKLITAFLALIIVGVLVALFLSGEAETPQLLNPTIDNVKKAEIKDLIVVDTPLPNSKITSPVKISGKARGNFYFEASFPVWLYDANGKQIVVSPVQAKGEWMTTEFVPFELDLTFSTPTTQTGKLVLKNDNPSGDPERDIYLEIPVRF